MSIRFPNVPFSQEINPSPHHRRPLSTYSSGIMHYSATWYFVQFVLLYLRDLSTGIVPVRILDFGAQDINGNLLDVLKYLDTAGMLPGFKYQYVG